MRYYRQGLSFLHGALDNDDAEMEKKHTHTREIEPHLSKGQTIKRTFMSIGHSSGRNVTSGDKEKNTAQPNGDSNAAGPSGSGSGTRGRRSSLGARDALGSRVRPGDGLPVPDMADMISSSENSSDEEDPTTAAAQGTDGDKKKKGKGKNKANLADVSQHTFYIQNSQSRLKLVAKNEVSALFLLAGERGASGVVWRVLNCCFSARWCNGSCLWSAWRASRIGLGRTGSTASRRFG